MDLDAIVAISKHVHTSLPERVEVFAEKLQLSPHGCWKLTHHGVTLGYGLAHPWRLHSIPPLDSFLQEIPSAADCLYIHDIALLPEGRGHGASADLLAILSHVASSLNLRHLACVSVYGTSTHWSRFGFQVVQADALIEKLESYGQNSCYMVCPLQPLMHTN
jgi:hypothetical protein